MKNIWLKTPGRTGSHRVLDYFLQWHGLEIHQARQHQQGDSIHPNSIYHDHSPWSDTTPTPEFYSKMTEAGFRLMVSLRRNRVEQAMSHFIALECDEWAHTRDVVRPEPFCIDCTEFDRHLWSIIEWERTIPQSAQRIYFEDGIYPLKLMHPPRRKYKHAPHRIVSRATPWIKQELVLNYNELTNTFKHYNES